MIDDQTKKKIIAEYMAITHFSRGWYEPLCKKYNITYDELLNIIPL